MQPLDSLLGQSTGVVWLVSATGIMLYLVKMMIGIGGVLCIVASIVLAACRKRPAAIALVCVGVSYLLIYFLLSVFIFGSLF